MPQFNFTIGQTASGAIDKSLFDAQTILIAIVDNTPIALTIDASRLFGRKSSGDLGILTGAEVLAILTGQAGAAFDWTNRELDNVKQLNLTDPTELTKSGGAITVTQGFHTVDTESNTSTDDLDTINGGATGDILILKAVHTDREIRVAHGVGNIYLRHREEWKSFSFISPAGRSGTFYAAGFYEAPATEAVLNQGSTTITQGTANISYAAHAFVVAKGDGANTSGDLVLKVTGTSIDDQGNRSAAAEETIVTDALLATFATDTYAETTKKWIGQITFTLSSSGGSSFNCSFNYGLVKYEDFGNRDFVVTDFECVGRSGGSDSGFNVRLFHHNAADWTYHTTAFVPGPTAGNASELANMNTTHSTEQDLNSEDHFAYKRDNLSTSIDGDDGEGLICEITTGANKAVESMSIHLGVSAAPKHAHIDNTEQGLALIYDGSNWLEL